MSLFENAFLPADGSFVHVNSKTIGATSGYISVFSANTAKITDLVVTGQITSRSNIVEFPTGLQVVGDLRGFEDTPHCGQQFKHAVRVRTVLRQELVDGVPVTRKIGVLQVVLYRTGCVRVC